MIVKLLTEHHLEFLSFKGGCRGSSESTLVKWQIVGNAQAECMMVEKCVWSCMHVQRGCINDYFETFKEVCVSVCFRLMLLYKKRFDQQETFCI